MAEQDRFEQSLEARIRAHVAPAGRDFDAVALTRAAAATQLHAHPRTSWLSARAEMRLVVLALLGLLVALLGIGGFVAASRLFDQSALDDAQEPGSFARTGSMAVARYWHTAVRLADGRVLIVGGFPQVPPDDNDPPAPAEVLPAEIFDPATGSFTSLPALTAAEQGASATLLRDGRVLIAGGRTRPTSPHPLCSSVCRLTGTALATAVLFDPRTNAVTPAGSLNVARFGHAAVLLDDGRVLVAGGLTGSVTDLGDGSSTMPGLASAELFDPTTDTFALAGSLADGAAPDMRSTFQIVATMLPDGRVLVENEIFDPRTGVFHAQTARDGFGPTTLGDPAQDASTPVIRYLTDQGELVAFDPAFWETSGGDVQSLIWKPAGTWRGVIATMLADGRVLWTGGQNTGPDAWIGDPLTHGSEPTGPLAETRYGHTATLLTDGRVLVVGGWHNTGEVDPKQGPITVSVASAELYLPPRRPRLLQEAP